MFRLLLVVAALAWAGTALAAKVPLQCTVSNGTVTATNLPTNKPIAFQIGFRGPLTQLGNVGPTVTVSVPPPTTLTTYTFYVLESGNSERAFEGCNSH